MQIGSPICVLVSNCSLENLESLIFVPVYFILVFLQNFLITDAAGINAGVD